MQTNRVCLAIGVGGVNARMSVTGDQYTKRIVWHIGKDKRNLLLHSVEANLIAGLVRVGFLCQLNGINEGIFTVKNSDKKTAVRFAHSNLAIILKKRIDYIREIVKVGIGHGGHDRLNDFLSAIFIKYSKADHKILSYSVGV